MASLKERAEDLIHLELADLSDQVAQTIAKTVREQVLRDDALIRDIMAVMARHDLEETEKDEEISILVTIRAAVSLRHHLDQMIWSKRSRQSRRC